MNLFDNGALASWLAHQGEMLWAYAVLPVVAIMGIYFTLRTGAVQLRKIHAKFKTLTNKALLKNDSKQLESGLNPTFVDNRLTELKNVECWTVADVLDHRASRFQAID